MKDSSILFKHAANMMQRKADSELATFKPVIWQTVPL